MEWWKDGTESIWDNELTIFGFRPLCGHTVSNTCATIGTVPGTIQVGGDEGAWTNPLTVDSQ